MQVKVQENSKIIYSLEEILQKGYKIATDIGVRIDIWTHFMRECIINYVH